MKHLKTFESYTEMRGDRSESTPREEMIANLVGMQECDYSREELERMSDEELTDLCMVGESVSNMSREEMVDVIAGMEDYDYSREELEEMREEELAELCMMEEGIRKFFKGHESKEDKEKAEKEFMSKLDEYEEKAEDNENLIFRRDTLERQARDNNFLGSLREVKAGRGKYKGKTVVTYVPGKSGFQKAISPATGGMRGGHTFGGGN